VLETPNVDHRIGARATAANPLARFGLQPFNSAFVDAERAGAIFLFGTDIYEEMPVHWLRVRKGVKNGAQLVIANPRSLVASRRPAARASSPLPRSTRSNPRSRSPTPKPGDGDARSRSNAGAGGSRSSRCNTGSSTAIG